MPVYALLLNFSIMFIIGCVYLGSTSAFNAIIGTGLTLQHITYAIPAALVIFRGRSEKVLPRKRAFSVPYVVGYFANIVTVTMAVFTLVFYNLPTTLPATGNNMSKSPTSESDVPVLISLDYGAAVLAVMTLVACINWFIHARKHFHGPRLDDDL